MGDQQGDDEEQLRVLAAGVDEACRPVRRRPRSLSSLREAFDATGARPTVAEIIAWVRARQASEDHPGGPGALET